VRRCLLVFALVGALASMAAAAGSGASRHVLLKVSLVQEATYRHPHPPVGDAGDTFSTTLRLNAIGTVLGFPDSTPMGTMAFSWGPLNGACSS
jgi:hypothetical protein